MDNDKLFAAAVFKTMLAKQGTRLSFTSNNHSQSNGLAERFNSALSVLEKCEERLQG